MKHFLVKTEISPHLQQNPQTKLKNMLNMMSSLTDLLRLFQFKLACSRNRQLSKADYRAAPPGHSEQTIITDQPKPLFQHRSEFA